MKTAGDVKRKLMKLEDKKQAKILSGFFKTGKGQYGEGDVFLGVKVPLQRRVAKEFKGLALGELGKLIKSKIHEHRLTSLFILIDNYKRADENEKKRIFDFYIKNAKMVNNWDLVDLSAPNIVGEYLLDKDRKILYKLVKSKNLWERRISVLATFTFISNGESKDVHKICELLLDDSHDLIHKATGWMLRELGKRVSEAEEEKFLKKYYKVMPRTMLRYSIERFSEKKRKYYMKKS